MTAGTKKTGVALPPRMETPTRPAALLTGCAISLGAPFWFDVLNKVSVVRSTVKPHEKSPEERSKG